MADEQTDIFQEAGAGVGLTSDAMTRYLSAKPTRAREEFLAGLLSVWAAHDRDGAGAKPTVEERRRGREGAKAALGEILR